MSHATKADMIAMFGDTEIVQITDRLNGGAIDDVVLQTALDDASSVADSYLPAIPEIPSRALVRHVAAIARFYLFSDKATDEVRERFDDAIKWLSGVSRFGWDYGTLPMATTPQAGIAQSASLVLPHEKYQVPRRVGHLI
ncbi:MAG: DUF1320 family protein [Mariprofundaceae bacterium]|nr:DUF1320 family protein [Mariprofundaceae bacterium]